MKLYVDIPGHFNTDLLFSCPQRPDIVLVTSLKMYIIELTICFETNLKKSREYKSTRYQYLAENVFDKTKDIELILVEISSLGFYTEDIVSFKDLIKSLKQDSKRILDKLCETAHTTYTIVVLRSGVWTNPELLLFT